jgi:hypothetical protein
MSRSYKKQPITKYAPRGNWGQKQANRKVRRYYGYIPFGMFYKRFYEQWDIHDIKLRETYYGFLKRRNEHIAWCNMRGLNFNKKYYGLTKKEAFYRWKRGYILK